MFYYKLTCIKEAPGIPLGYSFTVSEYAYNRNCRIWFDDDQEINDMMNKMVHLHRDGHTDYIKREPDLSYCYEGLKCPKCNQESLVGDETEEFSKYVGDGVTKYYKDIILKCALCDYSEKIYRVLARTHVTW